MRSGDTMDLLTLEGVTKTFGDVRAVDGLTLSIRQGEILGFLGTNGAGKTTTIKMLLGFFRPDSGKIAIWGGDPRTGAVRRRIGYMPETACYYPFLTIRELLDFYGGLCGMTRADIRSRAEQLIGRVGLAGVEKRLLRHYSKGMLQRAGIAQALLHDPDLLILDEPFTGLDPLARIQLRDLIRELRAQGKTIFFSSHELSEAELICDRVAMIRRGQTVWCGALHEVAGDGQQNLERIFLKMLGGEETA
ncbi:MAG TPA: ABC transporter ATP-binding protein [Kiritimatiellia bacterium]|nr:ABC transporter ATP-binding protein [Kiritimatiellia bacterium]HOM58461.1 ABC transporter ATP-binding protein [Kiritimatiellia bacterium]HOR98084.1 ABC transporter ATP-binding protein [Kiritimatiellia bacterium]HPC49116.1 ABC transporter ATP-binding protein [Kiritimatiellia bacterium]HPK37918.1 ABC transporter ATP-binding protein [Kiritimatiellia bacterium]